MSNSEFLDYDKIFLFGDSITERGFDQSNGFAFAAQLQSTYGRRLDVVGRGFSGYNSANALHVLPRIIPPVGHSKIRLMTIFFGANDAVLEGQFQRVSLEEYRRCLKQIVQHPLLKEHGTKFIIIVPPPICEYQTQIADIEKGKQVTPQRLAANTKRYADAALEVAAELNVPTVNLWKLFMEYAGWKEGEPLIGSKEVPESEKFGTLFCDGLHFNPEAYKILYDGLIDTIQKSIPELAPDALPYIFPTWDSAPR